MSAKKRLQNGGPASIYVVSGGSGASGRRIAETALAQFPALRLPIAVTNNVLDAGKLEEVVRAAEADGGTVVHTLVDGSLRTVLTRLCRERKVASIDLMGPLLRRIKRQAGAAPVGEPGLYRKNRQEYFDRFDAVDFTVSHDDGSRPEDLPSADLVIVGVSRCGKTPLCMYLAVHGWKVANIPFVHGIPLPEELFKLDRRRVIGLLIDIRRLMEHRKKRDRRMGRIGVSAYSDPSAVIEELEAARRAYRKGGFRVIDVTDKPIESTAADIIKYVTEGRHRGPQRPVPS
ncbi:MAG TPA: pyruvate, water dikinase regulatory protein [Candidatus Deferrimicrobiaceae bacterium]